MTTPSRSALLTRRALLRWALRLQLLLIVPVLGIGPLVFINRGEDALATLLCGYLIAQPLIALGITITIRQGLVHDTPPTFPDVWGRFLMGLGILNVLRVLWIGLVWSMSDPSSMFPGAASLARTTLGISGALDALLVWPVWTFVLWRWNRTVAALS
ncbi:MAG: hypothetical protein AAFV53_19300 [Myxococcota bacterium]